MPRYLSLTQVCRLTTLSPSTIHRQIRIGKFPHGRLLSSRRRGWLQQEIEDWINKRSDQHDEN